MTDEAFTKELGKLAELLRKKSMTAKAISKDLRVCKQTVYSRLEALKERGHKLEEVLVREGMSGPKALAYSIRVKR